MMEADRTILSMQDRVQGMKTVRTRCKAASKRNSGKIRCKSATVARPSSPPETRKDVQIPQQIKNSVVKLQAPNPQVPDGKTDVYLLGMSHVSQESVSAVKDLIEAVKPEVVLVELCRDRVNLIMNPDGPKKLQLWNTRRVRLSGLPKSEGWPSEKDILSVVSLRPDKAFTTPDAELDCVALLSTGLFRSARPVFRRPGDLDGPQFVRVNNGQLATVPPLGPVEFAVTPRILPPPKSFSVRVDSSLANSGIAVPQEEVNRIRHNLLQHFYSPEQLEDLEGSVASRNEEGKSPQSSPESPSGGSKTAKEKHPTTQSNELKADGQAAVLEPSSSNGASAQEIANSSTRESSQSEDPVESAAETQVLNKDGKSENEQKDADNVATADVVAVEQKKKKKVPSLDAVLQARQELIKVLKDRTDRSFDVSLQGIQTGQIEAVLIARQSEGFSSGLEASALGGEGFGIEKFKPQRGPLQISTNLKIPNVAKVLLRDGEHSEGYVAAESSQAGVSVLQPWDKKTLDTATMTDASEKPKPKFAERLASALTSLYGRLQGQAGEVTGVKPGAAWIQAMETGSENGMQQIHLGDMPADLVGQDLTQGIWKGVSVRVQIAAAIAALSTILAVTHSLPAGTEAFAVGAVASATALATLPFLVPLLEIYLFSRKSAEDIEKTVRITESLQERGTEMLRLPGEDAIINWPNAKSTVIDQRDAYMARTLWAAATGGACAPAFVLDTKSGRHAWQFAMPAEAPEGVSTEGMGQGSYKGLPEVKNVVGIVGSAHVGGIIREWQTAEAQDKISELLTKTR